MLTKFKILKKAKVFAFTQKVLILEQKSYKEEVNLTLIKQLYVVHINQLNFLLLESQQLTNVFQVIHFQGTFTWFKS